MRELACVGLSNERPPFPGACAVATCCVLSSGEVAKNNDDFTDDYDEEHFINDGSNVWLCWI